VERAAEDLQYDNTSGVHCAAAAGTVFVAATPLYDAATIDADLLVLDTRVAGSADGWLLKADASSNAWELTVRSGGATTANIASSTRVPVAGTTHVLAATWAVNDFRFYTNGEADGTPDTSGAAPTDIAAALYVGQTNARANQFSGNIAHLNIWNRALSAAEVARIYNNDYKGRWKC
jgi:hypothetical protein